MSREGHGSIQKAGRTGEGKKRMAKMEGEKIKFVDFGSQKSQDDRQLKAFWNERRE